MKQPDVTQQWVLQASQLRKSVLHHLPHRMANSQLHFTFLAIHQHAKCRAGPGQALNKLLAEKLSLWILLV